MILTIGGATQDIIFKTPEGQIIPNPSNPLKEKFIAFEYGAKIKIEDIFFGFGGGASNVAIGLNRLGCQTRPLVCVGSDLEGKSIKNNFRKEKIIISNVQTKKNQKTGFSMIVISGKEDDHVAFAYRGANDFLEIQEKHFYGAESVYISSLSGENSDEKLEKILKIALKKDLKIFFNPGSEQLRNNKNILKDFLEYTQVLILNLDEARELALKFGLTENKLEYLYLFETLKSLGPNHIVITDGKHGARTYDGKKEFHCSVSFPRPKVLDTTGAGDAFSAGFVASFLQDQKNVERSLKLGVLNAENVLQYYGAQKGLMRKKEMVSKFNLQN